MTKLNVIKVGGAVVEEPESLQQLLKAFAGLEGLKVLVHGGGRRATKVAASLGIESKMIEGRRVTDEDMLQVVTMVYGGLVNKNVVAKLQALGVNALGLTGADLGYMLSAKRPLKKVKFADGSVQDVDYGYVGDVKAVDSDILADLIAKGVVPVLAPLTHDGNGNLLNTNADTIASEAAKALAKHFDVTLTFCFEKKGVLSNPDDDESVISRITREDFEKYKADGTIAGGMIPKLDNAFDAIDKGVRKVVITKADELGKSEGTTIE